MIKASSSIVAMLCMLLVSFASIQGATLVAKNEAIDEQSSDFERVSLACPITQESNLGEIICAIAAEAKIDGLLSTYPKEFITAAAIIKSGKKTITVAQLKPIMPFILKRIAPYLLGTDLLDGVDYNAIIARAQRIKDGCNQSVNQDVTKPVTEKTSIDLDGIIRILCLIQKDIEMCCKKLCKKIDRCCDEIIDTITECCDDLSDQIQECCNDINKNIDECCDELNEAIEEVGQKVDECCDEILDTITECCDDLSNQIEECCDDLQEAIEEAIDEININIDECCQELNDKLDDVQEQLDDCCNNIIETVTECCQDLCEKVDKGFACDAEGIDQDDVGSELTITESGNYCLTEDVMGTIIINGPNITLDLNDRQVTGFIQVASSGDKAIVKNGKICAPAPTTNAAANVAAVSVDSDVKNVVLDNLVVKCEDTITQGINGRIGISNVGIKTKILNCCITSGGGAMGGGAVLPFIDGGKGGVGIKSEGEHGVIIHCKIITGKGGDGISQASVGFGGNGGAGIDNVGDNTFIKKCSVTTGDGGVGGNGSFEGGEGGDGGVGIINVSDNTTILNCSVSTGDGGDAGSSGAGSNGRKGGDGGIGIFVNGSAVGTEIRSCVVIKTGAGGIGGSGVVDGDRGSGGHGVFVDEDATQTEVRLCTISDTGAVGATGAVGSSIDGQAIRDENPDSSSSLNASTIYQNFAYGIANIVQRYKIHASLSESGVPLSGNPASGGNCPSCPFDNIFVGLPPMP